MRNHPDTITLLGKQYPLKEVFVSKHSTCCPKVMVEGKPLVGVSYVRGVIENESEVKRAEISLQSYLDSNGKYSSIPDLSLVQVHQLSEETLERTDLTIDLYDYMGQKHIAIESTNSKLPLVKFCIWDRDLTEKIYKKLREGKRDFRGRPYPNFHEYFDLLEV